MTAPVIVAATRSTEDRRALEDRTQSYHDILLRCEFILQHVTHNGVPEVKDGTPKEDNTLLEHIYAAERLYTILPQHHMLSFPGLVSYSNTGSYCGSWPIPIPQKTRTVSRRRTARQCRTARRWRVDTGWETAHCTIPAQGPAAAQVHAAVIVLRQ